MAINTINMKKFIKLPFAIGLVIWFSTAFYLSLNSIFNLFIETDPYIARGILAFSFIWLVVFGLLNYKKNGDIADVASNLNVPKGQKIKPKCKTCGQR